MNTNTEYEYPMSDNQSRIFPPLSSEDQSSLCSISVTLLRWKSPTTKPAVRRCTASNFYYVFNQVRMPYSTSIFQGGSHK